MNVYLYLYYKILIPLVTNVHFKTIIEYNLKMFNTTEKIMKMHNFKREAHRELIDQVL